MLYRVYYGKCSEELFNLILVVDFCHLTACRKYQQHHLDGWRTTTVRFICNNAPRTAGHALVIPLGLRVSMGAGEHSLPGGPNGRSPLNYPKILTDLGVHTNPILVLFVISIPVAAFIILPTLLQVTVSICMKPAKMLVSK
ncbi:hypothetical protein EVAR_14613_1 [Eumeta japonica]|uniref:Uncharacterized protein n=1 Tax=Eumeta variegata TaxID=151549 RepID=A0A4C1UWB7_EUMVA|nr:hypothetical protein EVAR_14613_1 [Eumeta japonica]